MKSSLKYDSTNMMVFAFVGILIKLFFGNNTTADGSSGPASSAVWGYGIVALSVFSILFITFALATQMTAVSQYNTMDFIMKLVQGSLVPFSNALNSCVVDFNKYDLSTSALMKGMSQVNIINSRQFLQFLW